MRVLGFAFDDVNEGKLASHGVTPEHCEQALQNGLAIRINRRARAARWIAFGRTDAGECLAIPLQPTPERDIWRPVTAMKLPIV